MHVGGRFRSIYPHADSRFRQALTQCVRAVWGLGMRKRRCRPAGRHVWLAGLGEPAYSGAPARRSAPFEVCRNPTLATIASPRRLAPNGRFGLAGGAGHR
jgi:hypothetical protein